MFGCFLIRKRNSFFMLFILKLYWPKILYSDNIFIIKGSKTRLTTKQGSLQVYKCVEIVSKSQAKTQL